MHVLARYLSSHDFGHDFRNKCLTTQRKGCRRQKTKLKIKEKNLGTGFGGSLHFPQAGTDLLRAIVLRDIRCGPLDKGSTPLPLLLLPVLFVRSPGYSRIKDCPNTVCLGSGRLHDLFTDSGKHLVFHGHQNPLSGFLGTFSPDITGYDFAGSV